MPSPRIPTDLQAIIVASNQGEEVHKPPASKSAFRVFQTAFFASVRRFKGRNNENKPHRSTSISTVSSFPSTVSGGDAGAGIDNNNNDIPWGGEIPNRYDYAPQAWVQDNLPARGYGTKSINTVTTAYMTQPTEVQLASYDGKTLALATSSHFGHQVEQQLKELMSCGISLNACNMHGETLMHKACRLGYHHILKVFIDLGAELHVCDAQGRTLLHDACWGARPSFQTFSLLMHHAPELLFMADCRGACPLEYVQKSHYEFWIDFLEENKDTFWPVVTSYQATGTSNRAMGQPFTLPLPDPANALSCELALLVAAGRMEPDEVVLLASDTGSDLSTCTFDDDDDDSDHNAVFWSDDREDLIEELTGFLRQFR